jgi:hypothetical protein
MITSHDAPMAILHFSHYIRDISSPDQYLPANIKWNAG